VSARPVFEDVEVQLSGHDGNAFAIIGRVRRAMEVAGHADAADQFAKDAMTCGSYDDLLVFVMNTVVVT
jgi:hypothetical protein